MLKPVIDVIKNNYRISGLYGSAFSIWLGQQLGGNLSQTHLVITQSKLESERLFQELQLFFDESSLAYLPSYDSLVYQSTSPTPEVIASRLDALAKIKGKKSILLISEVHSLFDKLILLEQQEPLKIVLKQTYKREVLLQNLTELGYNRVSVVETQGEFAIRGEIFDIFPIQFLQPVRLIFFDDQIEEIRYFDTESQSSLNSKQKLVPDWFYLPPATEIVATEKNRERAFDCLQKNRLKISVPTYQEALKNLEQENFFLNTDKYRCYFSEKLYSWIYLLAGEFKVLLWQKEKIDLAIRKYWSEINEEYKLYSQQEPMPPSPSELYLSYEKLEQLLTSFKPLEFSESIDKTTEKNYNFHPISSIFLQQGKKVTLSFKLEQIKKFNKKGVNFIISAKNQERADRLASIFEEFELSSKIHQQPVTFLKEKFTSLRATSEPQQHPLLIPTSNDINILPYPLQKSFCFMDRENLESLSYCLIYEDDLFGYKSQIKKQQKISDLKTKISELNIGDFVVHIDYGIGKYCGIQKLEVGDQTEDFLLLEYQKEDKLYVTVDEINYKIQRYNTGNEKTPVIDTLGSKKWKNARKKVEINVQKIAEELIKIYADKKLVKSHSFDVSVKDLQIFVDDFPFMETEDQLKAIEEIYQDLKSEQPMDRLICGDAGFGKTEVALRATFQVVMSGYQVLLLAPTTILVQQHLEIFRKRFKNFPVRVECLSRFLSVKEAKQNIKDFSEGKIDILIGTHKLLNDQLSTETLGLLIIDEEHRFGVLQKEKLRKLRTKIDLLTLSATPIPRTLHMALLGIRDISLIVTPPHDRKNIKTRILYDDEVIIKEIVKREIDRKGQVFILYNEVKNIEIVLSKLKKMMPSYSIRYAHGQMPRKDLEQIIQDFLQHKFSILLSTTIIESGLDIPNANTLIVYNSDKFGLAQLYQIRGRVGRSNKSAYAYFLIKQGKKITETAQQRLGILVENQSLGGYRIANQDLEIRGVGNLVGTEQSGQIQTVGYDLFMAMIDETIQKLQQSTTIKISWTEIKINSFIKGYIPTDYIEDMNLRLYTYQTINQCRSEEKIENCKLDLRDKFGKIPDDVKNLFEIVRLKNWAFNNQIKEVHLDIKNIKLQFCDFFQMKNEKILELTKQKNIKLLKNNLISVNFLEEISKLNQVIDRIKFLIL